MIIGLLALFFITSNIAFSEIKEDTKEKPQYSQKSLNEYIDFLYSQIKIKEDKLFFKQSFTLLKDTHIELIGDDISFPKNVTNNKKPIKVIKKNHTPYAFLTKGEHNIEGVITLSPDIKQIRVPKYIHIIELQTEDNKNEILNLTSPYLRIKANNLLENLNDDDNELVDEIVDIANSIDINIKKVMFHFTLDTF